MSPPPQGIQRFLDLIASAMSSKTPPFPTGNQSRDIVLFDLWLDHPGYGATPQSMLAAFREAEAGYPRQQCNLIDDLIEVDAHARSLFEKREEAVAGKPSTTQAGASDEASKQVARFARFALGRICNLLAAHEHLLTFNRYGYAGAELTWGLLEFEGRSWIGPVAITIVPARRFRIVSPAIKTMLAARGEQAELDDLRIFCDASRPEGDALIPGKWIVLRRRGDLARAGLMRTGAWNCMAKRFGFRDWIVLSQKYGIPIPITTYKTQGGEADDEAKNVAIEIVKKIGTDGGAAVPDTITLQFHKAFEGDAGGKLQGSLIAYANRENSKLVNGSTLANDNGDSGGASYALGDIHDGVRWEAVLLDAVRLALAIQTQVYEPMMAFNGLAGGAATPVHHIQVVRDLTPKALVDIANVLTNELGVKVSTEQLRVITGMHEPVDDTDAAPGAPVPVTPIGGGA